MEPDAPPPQGPVARFLARAFGWVVLGCGAAGAVYGGAGLAHTLAVWSWGSSECEVADVRIEELEPWRGQVYFHGRYDVRWALYHRASGRVFEDVPALPGNRSYYEAADYHLEVGPATPGALIDCRVAPDGSAAYVRPEPAFVVAFRVAGVLFAVVFALCGWIVLRPRLVDEVADRIEHRRGG